MILKIKNTDQTLCSDVILANSFLSRSKGLLGLNTFSKQKCLWIPQCSLIHTFFMKFNIDLVFLNKKLEIVEICEDVSPGKMRGCLKASSVLEFFNQQISTKVSKGDFVYVAH